MPIYFTPNGPKKGTWLDRDSRYAGAVGVHESHEVGMPIGMALPKSRDANGAGLWKLTVHGVELEGLWVVVNREFRPAG